MIKKFEHIETSLNEMRTKGNPKGEETGFCQLDDIFTLKQGSYTFILAAPHHGKSEFCFELLFNQAAKFGKRSVIYSPETGSIEDIYAEFIHKFTGKPFYKSIPGAVDDREFSKAVNYIDHMFSIVDADDKAYSFEDLTNLVTDEQIVLSDPWNELKHDMANYGGRQDLYIEDLIGHVRRYCKKEKKHFIQTLHPASQQIVTKGDVRYYPMPAAREAAGGQALFRKAMTWINLWRPDSRLCNEHGIPYEENEVLVTVEKAKPKGVAKRGTVSLFFDWKRNRYYQKLSDGERYYAFEKPTEIQNSAIQPNQSFDIKQTDNNLF